MKRHRTSDIGHRTSSGLTIIELMINVVTIAILAGAFSALFLKWIQLWRLSSAKADIQRDARACISQIDRFLRQATASTVVVDRYDSNQPPYSRITFTKDSQQYIYYQKGQTLYEVASGTRTLATSLRVVQFIYPETSDNSILSVSVTFEKKTYSSQVKALQLSVQKVRIMN